MVQTMTLVCPSCGGRTNIPNDADRYVCDYCGNTHAFQLPTRPEQNASQAGVRRSARRLIGRPSGVTLQKKRDRIELSWRWFSPKYFFMLFFVIAWDSFLIFWYSMAGRFGDAPWIMFVFPLAHVAVGIFLTYTTLAGFFNRTTIKIDRESFIVHHDPFPWPGEVKIPIEELDQFYCTKSISRGENSTTVTYQLRAILADRREVKLISNMDSPDIAIFLEQQLEGLLKIQDRPVYGEME